MVPLCERAANWFSMLELNSHMASNFLCVGRGSWIALWNKVIKNSKRNWELAMTVPYKFDCNIEMYQTLWYWPLVSRREVNDMLLHNESNNKISVCNVISCLFEFVLGASAGAQMWAVQLAEVDVRAEHWKHSWDASVETVWIVVKDWTGDGCRLTHWGVT